MLCKMHAMNAEPADDPTKRPFRRRVFYIPGYDPFHPRRYRELYRKEGAAQAAISGYQLALKPKKAGGPYGWHVDGVVGGKAAEVEMEVLVWSDLVRTSMTAGIPGTYLQLLRTAWAYIGSGALFRLMRLRKGPMIAALYPIFFLLGQLAIAMAAGWALGSLVAAYSHWAAGLALGLGLAYGILHLFRRYDHKVFAYYLMHDYAYSAQVGGANPPELEARMAQFRSAIRAAMDGGFDEVLVVGHSSGAHLAVSILADLLREGVPGAPALSLLTLGHVVPMVSFLPKAARLRRDLHDLSTAERLTWVDVTAPGDGCAFALCDPVAVTGVAPAGKRWPLVMSAAFTQTLSAERWRELRWKFFRLHFQYLCAFDRPRDYDYFQITAGPVPLGARYAARKPSASRIEVARSGYRSMA
jgi:hypothetical protein